MDENLGQKVKSFWDRPEGTTGMIFNVAAIVGGGLLLLKYSAFLALAFSNLLTAAISALVLAGLGYMIMDNKFRTLLWFGYKSLMRGITGLFITIDPIGILENYVEFLHKNITKMDEQLGSLKGQMAKLKRLMDGNASEMENNLKLADKAKDKGDKRNVMLMTRQAGRLKESNMNLQTLYTKMEVMYRVLSKMYDNADTLAQDTEAEVQTRKAEYEMIKTSYSAMKSAMSVINGDPDRKALFEQSMEYLVDDVGAKVGDMERFMEMSQKVIDSVDLQNGVFEDSGMKMLEEWEKQADTAMLSPAEKKEVLKAAYNDKEVLELGGVKSSKKKAKAQVVETDDDIKNLL